MPEKEKFSKVGVDESKKIEYQYVKISNPITLGMQIAVGMFVVFPLFLIAILIALTIFGGVLSSI